MQELRLVAVSEDGTYLVLATAGRGTRFTLPVDDRVRAAVRGHFSRLGQFEIEVESPLRPKEIQARIRSGETAEEIAESAGIPVERVRWFEGPVLQEREYMAQQAQRVTVRRPGESTPGPPLGETVEERLGRGGVDLEDVEWDAWKCDDGTWRVRLSFFDNGRPHAAEWAFDPRRRNVSPLDEIAARLTAVDWDDDELSDTVTPLVPRRPAMKVVSDGRDVGREIREVGPRDLGRGLPAEPEPPLERASEPPLRAAEPREYIVERGRIIDPRPAFPSRQQPGRDGGLGTDREPIRPFDGSDQDAPASPASGAPWRRAPEPSLEELEGLEGLQERATGAEPRDARPEEPEDESAAAEAVAEEPDAPQERADEPAPERAADDEAAATDEDDRPDTAAETDEAGDEAGDEAAAAGDEAAEPADDEAAEEVAAEADAPETDADARPADEPEESTEIVAERAEESAAEQDGDAAGDAAGDEPAAAEPETTAAPVAEEAAEQAPAARPEPRDEPAPRKPAPREQAPREQPKPAPPPRAPRREPARPAAKKKPATRPTMPAAQDKPVTGPPAAAAADASAPQRPARARRKAKGKRASVPSWDEIMFGARRPE
ncbi:septation protein SepH [Actinomadura algeriensis]|uniref:DUF3071 domain-containing protein n=1 Tax=Actinomadura algeriensis TaxID=1679523 RepID=A0ABR9K5D5_9ACTN|nr:septation protein SepH [Actinomadura algeriensis]MBE1537798.1 hypothetical protein [Actinomadura algeriensis]